MADNDLVLADHTVSRNHAELARTALGWSLRDLGSRNGTQVNGVLVQESRLVPGSTLIFGRFEVRFEEEQSSEVRIEPAARRIGRAHRRGDHHPLPRGGAGHALRPPGEQRILDQKGIDRLARASRILAVLSEVSRTPLSAATVEQVLTKIMDVILSMCRPSGR